MKLCQITAGADVTESRAAPGEQVDAITVSSQRAAPHIIYVALSGRHDNGHRYVSEVTAKGGIAVIDDSAYMQRGCVLVRDSRRALAAMSANLYGNPAKALKIIGVTGTAGKTSVCCHIRNIISAWGCGCGMIGTVENAREMGVTGGLTTPLPPELHRMLYGFVAAGLRYAVIEASSQAIEQGRLFGIDFEVGVFTNLGRDHLDYHGDMESYFEAKAALFAKCRAAAVNTDDEYGRRLAGRLGEFSGFSLNGGDITAKNIQFVDGYTDFELALSGRLYPVRVGAGRYSVYNALAAAAAARAIGVPPITIAEGLNERLVIPGRMEQVELAAPFSVYIDFAHTPEELAAALAAARQLTSGRVIALFGCGGDRDREKRAPMAAASCMGAELSIFTSCNPRSEDPREIIADMMQGVNKGARCLAVLSRRAAIELALRAAAPGDLILLAGKGHEIYQIIGDRMLPFDERVETERIYLRLKNSSAL